MSEASELMEVCAEAARRGLVERLADVDDPTAELVLDDVIVDEERSLLPGVSGIKGPLSCLTQARYGIAWGALGAADAYGDAAALLADLTVIHDALVQTQLPVLAPVAEQTGKAAAVQGLVPPEPRLPVQGATHWLVPVETSQAWLELLTWRLEQGDDPQANYF